MNTPTRIYLTTDKATGKQQLVRATNQAQALHRLVNDRFTVGVATQDELIALVSAGAQVLEQEPEAKPGAEAGAPE